MAISRQAVVIIHGIGEQKPMQTLRGFVTAVWSLDKNVAHEYSVEEVWSKPETHSGTFELRRLTTGRNAANIRTDFFEFYWQHLMTGTTIGHIWSWARILLARSPKDVPLSLRGVWTLLWILVVFGALAIWALSLPNTHPWSLPAWGALIAGVIVVPFFSYILRRILGDAARYLYPDSENIAARRAIRHAGLELLKSLHRDQTESGKPKYHRIVVVGHSLGSVIAYDILTHAWAEFGTDFEKPANSIKQTALDALEEAAIKGEWSPDTVWINQRALFDEQIAFGSNWRVTDLVTIGSPLAHAQVLLAQDMEDLEVRQRQREIPTCPPALEQNSNGVRYFAYPAKSIGSLGEPKFRTLHFAALFAATRWTNIYAPAKRIFWGDVIGGPLGPLFGVGVRDVAVVMDGCAGFLSHTKYWDVERAGTEESVKAVRLAVDLLDRAGSED